MAAKKRTDFFETDEGQAFERSLKDMVSDTAYNTTSSYSANSELYPDHKISFVSKHKDYIFNHPATNPQQYLSNLRLMTRVR